MILERNKHSSAASGVSSSGLSRISTTSVQRVINNLLNHQLCELTKKTYLSVWRQFNRFLVKLDKMPKDWEYRTILFIGYMIDCGLQSCTVEIVCFSHQENIDVG